MQNPSESYFVPQWAPPSQHTAETPHSEEMERHRHRASTAPPSQFAASGFHPSLHPRTLTPGFHVTIPQRHDLFFQQPPYSPSFSSPQFPPPLPPMPPQLASSAASTSELAYLDDESGYAQSGPSTSTPPPPPPPIPPLPPSLVPAHRSTTPLLSSSSSLGSATPPPIPPLPESFHRRLSYAPPPRPPPLPQKPTIPLPPFPPPPPPAPVVEKPSLPPPPQPEELTETSGAKPSKAPADEDELAAVLAISQSESDQREKLRLQEEEELAKALEESLRSAPGQTFTYSTPDPPVASTSRLPTPPRKEQDLPSLRTANLYDFANLKSHSEPWQSSPSTSQSQLPDDLNAASSSGHPVVEEKESPSREKARESPRNRLASLSIVEEEKDLPEYVTKSQFQQGQEDNTVLSPQAHSISTDEEFARRLAEEEEAEYERAKREREVASPVQVPAELPQYSPSNAPQPLPKAKADMAAETNQAGEPSYQAEPVNNPMPDNPPPIYSPPSRHPSATARPVTAPSGQDSASSSIATPITEYFPSSYATSESSVSLDTSPTTPQEKGDGKVRLSMADMKTHRMSSLVTSPGMMNPNHFIDAELLMGVSVGFVPPTLSSQLLPMSIPMPNVIDLPYGKYPPLHFQAPTWRDLLRLLARLSNCRFQASVEAMAIAKADLKLRTVIQFVRPHHASPEWRTIIWFTLDYPEPQQKWNPRHPALPYSYSLSTVPTLLRDLESEMSKVYTVTETPMTPFPKLPISFPDVALYLQAALDESRRYLNVSSSEVRKLARMVAACYPAEHIDTSATDPPSRMSRMIKWPWGKGRPTKKGGGSNEETYDLVTPFVVGEHEWG